MNDGLAFVSRVIVTLAAITAAIILLALLVIGDVIAIGGCAICDDAPPNYLAAGVITIVGAMLERIIFIGWRAACSTDGYRA